MSQDMFKAPKPKTLKRTHPRKDVDDWSPGRKRKTKNNFLNFCNIVLAYTQYDQMKQEELRLRNNNSPLDSGGSTVDSFSSDSAISSYATEDEALRPPGMLSPISHAPSPAHRANLHAEDDSFESVTCFCMKPFAGRPMIECCKCLTWIHLSCAKIRKNNIPDEFICQRCREAKANKRKSFRIKGEKQQHLVRSPSQSPQYHPSATFTSTPVQHAIAT